MQANDTNFLAVLGKAQKDKEDLRSKKVLPESIHTFYDNYLKYFLPDLSHNLWLWPFTIQRNIATFLLSFREIAKTIVPSNNVLELSVQQQNN